MAGKKEALADLKEGREGDDHNGGKVMREIPLNSSDIEYAVARHFGWRQNLIVPNVSWGMGFRHELDLIVVKLESGYAYEVEIKVSVSDLKRDAEKRHGHFDDRIKRLYFAFPKSMSEFAHLVPSRAGILLVGRNRVVELLRPARLIQNSRGLTDAEVKKLLHLASMRVWTLKEKFMDQRKRRETECGRRN